MEIKMLRDNSIWIRSEDNELYLVGCDSDGKLYATQTQKRQHKEKGEWRMMTQQEYDNMIKRNEEYQKAKNKGKCPRCMTSCIKNNMVSVSIGTYCNGFCAYNSLIESIDSLNQEAMRFILRREPRKE